MIKFEQEVVDVKAEKASSKPRHYIAYENEDQWQSIQRCFKTSKNAVIRDDLVTIAKSINRNREFLDKFYSAKTLPTLVDRMIQLSTSINEDLKKSESKK